MSVGLNYWGSIFHLFFYWAHTNTSSSEQLFIGILPFQQMKLINIFMMEFISVYKFNQMVSRVENCGLRDALSGDQSNHLPTPIEPPCRIKLAILVKVLSP